MVHFSMDSQCALQFFHVAYQTETALSIGCLNGSTAARANVAFGATFGTLTAAS